MNTENSDFYRSEEEKQRWENIRQCGYSNGLPSNLREKARDSFGKAFVMTAARGGAMPVCVGDVVKAKRTLNN